MFSILVWFSILYLYRTLFTKISDLWEFQIEISWIEVQNSTEKSEKENATESLAQELPSTHTHIRLRIWKFDTPCHLPYFLYFSIFLYFYIVLFTMCFEQNYLGNESTTMFLVIHNHYSKFVIVTSLGEFCKRGFSLWVANIQKSRLEVDFGMELCYRFSIPQFTKAFGSNFYDRSKSNIEKRFFWNITISGKSNLLLFQFCL